MGVERQWGVPVEFSLSVHSLSLRLYFFAFFNLIYSLSDNSPGLWLKSCGEIVEKYSLNRGESLLRLNWSLAAERQVQVSWGICRSFKTPAAGKPVSSPDLLVRPIPNGDSGENSDFGILLERRKSAKNVGLNWQFEQPYPDGRRAEKKAPCRGSSRRSNL